MILLSLYQPLTGSRLTTRMSVVAGTSSDQHHPLALAAAQSRGPEPTMNVPAATRALSVALPTRTHPCGPSSHPRLCSDPGLAVRFRPDLDETDTLAAAGHGQPPEYIPTAGAMCALSATKLKGDTWKEVVRHWVSGLPELGLDTPLRDWPKEWWSGRRGENHQRFGVLRHQREIIATEFVEFYQSDEARFLAAYGPAAEKGIAALRHAITSARLARR